MASESFIVSLSTQLEYEDKVLDVLVYVGQVFGNVPGDGLVTILHVGYEYVQVVVFLGQDIGEVHAEYLIGLFGDECFRRLVSYGFALGQHGGLQVEQRKYF